MATPPPYTFSGPTGFSQQSFLENVAPSAEQLQGGPFQTMMDLARNPGNIGAMPGFNFLMDSGMNALNRTAGARRKRFAGQTMAEAQKFGQDLSSTYWGDMMRNLAPAAEMDYKNRQLGAQMQAEQMQRRMFELDPTGMFSRMSNSPNQLGQFLQRRPNEKDEYYQRRTGGAREFFDLQGQFAQMTGGPKKNPFDAFNNKPFNPYG